MKQDNLYTSTESRAKLMDGVSKVAHAVGATMGTSGGNSLLEAIERPGFYATNDGFSIANSIKLADPLEEIGRKVLVEAINRANRKSGDGSSTTCVLTAAILEEGMKHLGEASPMEIKRSLEACIPVIEESIKNQKKEITVNTVAQVASISAEDESIGAMIQEIYQKIGKGGIISWDVSKTSEDGYTIGTGLVVNGATYTSPYMCDVDASGAFTTSVKLENPAILLCRQKVNSAQDFNTLFYTLNNQGIKEVVLFCDDIEFPVIADLIQTRIKQGFRTVVVKMPVLWRDEWWEDLAIASGGTIISPATIKIKDMKQEHLGTFGHIVIDKQDTYIDGINDVSIHIAKLQEEGSDQSLIRAARLNTKTARYFVGAHSESALAYRRLKVEDAINAASCALENGVVVGGGVALLKASYLFNKGSVGEMILSEALMRPAQQIITNCGLNPNDMIDNAFEGFNSKTGTVEDLMRAGVVDPADVVLNAVKSAIGVAASILTIGSVVTLPREEEKNAIR